MTDTDLMPFGKYRGEKMGNVPASYLRYIYDKGFVSAHKFCKVFRYIEENRDVIEHQIQKENENKI